jgi:hypothetical protein
MSQFLFLSNFIKAKNKTRQERYVNVIIRRGRAFVSLHPDFFP